MSMKQFLKDRGIDIEESTRHRSWKLTAEGFMPLSVECWLNAARKRELSVCHYGEQNGDLMRDPEILYIYDKEGNETPIYYRNDYAGVENHYEDKPAMQQDLKEFTKTWIENLRSQGHELKQEMKV